jgi:HCOMODA/2-hydroxy-3-carboxy-muconic semialdehyde decarboxylase
MTANAQMNVRKAAGAMARAGLSTAFGHCSVRLDADSFRSAAPERSALSSLVKAVQWCRSEGSLPEGVLGEVRIHQQIYARRPEIGAICRFASPNVTGVSALGRAPKIRQSFGALFAPEVKYSDDTRLMRDDAIAAEVAQATGDTPGIIVRGIGAVTAGVDIKQALCLAWFLEDMSRLELAVLSSGQAEQAPVYRAEEALNRTTWAGQVAERAWDHLTALDPE